jgi:hypothetical protein
VAVIYINVAAGRRLGPLVLLVRVHWVIRWKEILSLKYNASGILPAGRVAKDEGTFSTKTII